MILALNIIGTVAALILCGYALGLACLHHMKRRAERRAWDVEG